MSLHFIFDLAKRDISEKYSGSTLGAIWNFVYPLVNIFIFTVIFSNLMGSRLPGSSSTYSYGFYLTAGIIPWTAFSNTLLRTSTVFLDKKYIISKVKVNLSSFPLFIAISESITFFVTIGIFLVLLVISGYGVSRTILLVPLLYIIQQMFAYGLGFLISIFVVFIRDLKEMINIVLQFWFWFTPIVYLYDVLPEFAKKILVLNPAFAFIHGYQSIFIYKEIPDLGILMYLALTACVILFISYFIFRKLEKDIRDCI